ncbi:MAG: SDR family NAD(P)-dependent oxidoreductase [Lachnospiraceae bacterium]|nr:SDR family NAD(P)-dependent oxidoreductase [Lachnospiraceae bacterium]
MNIIIITGASSGIGREFARQLDKRLYSVDVFWLISRRKKELEALAQTLEHPVRIFDMDLTLESDIFAFKAILEKECPVVRMLVNCAGYGLMGAFDRVSMGEQSGQIDLNCKALVQMTHMCIPYMKPNSRILQLASSAAFLPQADFAVYAASKSFVLSFSRALAQELKEKSIYVTAVCPGPVNTAFFERAEKFGSTLAVKKLTMVEASEVVSDALKASAQRRRVCITGIPMKLFYLAAGIFPHEIMLQGAAALKKLEKIKTGKGKT